MKLWTKIQSISAFFDIAKFTNFRRKVLMLAKIKGCETSFIYFLDLL